MSWLDYSDTAPRFAVEPEKRRTIAEVRAEIHARCKERDRLYPDHCHNGRWRPARTTVWRIAP